ncbi:MAG TPA: anti-sigma factor [Pyrinomonadaceae bacterium]|nr:anti-sigma factor [Pyrinomonadaceae bacterium]
MDDHQEYQELLALHALDALGAAEARSLEEHLASCAECRASLIEWRDATGLLAHASTPAAPNDELRARILAAARTETRAPQTENSARVVPMPIAPRRSNLWPNLMKIAAAIAIVGLLVGMIVFWRRDVGMQRDIARLTRERNRTQDQLAREREALAKEREAIALLNSRDTKKMELAGTQTAQNARGTFVFDPQTGRAMLLTEGLPATPADKAYEVWFIPKGHTPMPGKMFTVDSSGRAMVSGEIPLEARANAVIAITLEPKKGSAAPTSAIYLSSPSS